MNQALALVALVATSVVAACSSAPLAPGQGGTGTETGTPSPTGTGTGQAPAPTLASDYVDYPAGPYGTTRGAIIQNLEFLGWKHPDQANYDVANLDKVRLSDFYNPDGRSDLKLLAVNASAVWCAACKSEYEEMNTNGTYTTYRAKGVEILGTLFEDNFSYPAQPADLTRWGQAANHAVAFPLVLDPGKKTGVYFESDAVPLNMLIDVRTMTIVFVTMGYSADYWSSTVQGLLDKM